MRLDYLADDSLEHPILRLWDFTASEAGSLHVACCALSEGRVSAVAVHDLACVNPGKLKLTFIAAVGDIGLSCDFPEFRCELMREGWDNVAGLIEPFAKEPARGFQWLAKSPEAFLLLSPDGRW